MAEKKQTHINVLPQTQRQISILASVQSQFGYELVQALVNAAWEKAKKDGLVTDAMLQSQPSPSSKEKKGTPALSSPVAA